MEEYGPYMLPGTVLVLKNIPVIMTVRHHYMALTVNNLVAMYKPKGLHQTGIWAKEVCKLTKEARVIIKSNSIARKMSYWLGYTRSKKHYKCNHLVPSGIS